MVNIIAVSFNVYSNVNNTAIKPSVSSRLRLPLLQEEVAPHLQQCKVFLPGTGNQGHAILLLRSKLHQPSDDIETLKKFMIYTFDAALGAADPAKNPGRLMLGVMDLRDIGMGNLDLEGLVTAFKVRGGSCSAAQAAACVRRSCARKARHVKRLDCDGL